MKSLIVITVLAVLAGCNDAASIPQEVASHQRGDVRQRDIMFHEHNCYVPGIPNAVQREDVVYRGNSTTKITSVRVNRLPSPPGNIEYGALGTNHITIRVTSAPGEGIFSTIQFWGHYTDWV